MTANSQQPTGDSQNMGDEICATGYSLWLSAVSCSLLALIAPVAR